MSNTQVSSHTCTRAALYVYDTGDVELAVQEVLRLDRLVYDDTKGFGTEAYGALLQPGTTTLSLPSGVYHFKALHNVEVRFAEVDAIDVVVPKSTNNKDPWPDPPARLQLWFPVTAERWASHTAVFNGLGFDSPVVSYTTSRAALYVYEPAHVEFAAGESVRLDQLVFSVAKGFSTERYGDLLPAGVAELLLPAGVYHVKTENDVDVRVIDPGSVEVVIAPKTTNNKDPFPDPPVRAQPWFPVTPELWSTHVVAFNGFGFDTAAEATSYVGQAAALYVYEVGDVELTTGETVQLDRLVFSGKGFSAERFGDLIGPGTTVLRLPAGVFHFRAESDVELRIVGTGPVDLVAPTMDSDPKDPWPPPQATAQQWFPVSPQVWATHTTAFVGRGYDSTVTCGAGARR